MICPFCQFENTRVIDSRLVVESNKIRRRRQCERCEERFTTYEMIEDFYPMLVKGDGRREAYNPNKVRAGINRAIEKRPITAEQVDAVIHFIETQLRSSADKEIPAKAIGEWIMQQLIEIDEVAYVRFASVYRSFQDVSAFQREIERLQASFIDKGQS
ncbi:transcriptional regulator NrdR [Ostreibacterium oceani]|uniref:Transcriptional repressor NrdR n=1 Tax=Ostreibacterium oceani TaxID=2654998 RepID=A0A6N7EUJ0_9GAMM|nr:transcriptional regulator NrdR [Ostreibacterium oceani]MPV85285.1 transcriptional repressor NrdR [Ostreibacterium oceani]